MTAHSQTTPTNPSIKPPDTPKTKSFPQRNRSRLNTVYARILTIQTDNDRYNTKKNAMIPRRKPKRNHPNRPSHAPSKQLAHAAAIVAATFIAQALTAAAPNTQPTKNTTTQPADIHIRECVVTLISGRKITGELIRENTLIVVVSINGIDTTFQRKNIASLTILPPVEQRYQQLRAAIPDEDIDARLVLVEWLRTRQAYSLAIKELESVLLISPSNPQAKILHTWLTEREKLTPTKPKQRPSIKPSTKPTKTATPKSSKVQRNNITPLTPEQINLIKVYEIDLRNPPKIKVPDATIQTLMLRHPSEFSPNKEERDAIFKLPEIEKLRLLFEHKARDLYSQVIIKDDPISIKAFRENVHAQRGWLLNACATTRCHGGMNAGNFQLINAKPNTDQTIYTNLLILERYKLADGSPLINYNAPDRSPLLQMAMISKNTLTPHPPIPLGFPGTGFRPIFRSTRDRKYREAIDWIKSMYQPRPEYEFIPPILHQSPATQDIPADSPADSP
jgi:hypothetical protein